MTPEKLDERALWAFNVAHGANNIGEIKGILRICFEDGRREALEAAAQIIEDLEGWPLLDIRGNTPSTVVANKIRSLAEPKEAK